MLREIKITRLTLINIILFTLFMGTLFSPILYSGLRRSFTDIQNGSAAPLTADQQRVAVTLQEAYTNVYHKASPSVVYIRTNILVRPRYLFEYYRQVEGAGSGFIIDNDGYIVTNNHVVAGAQKIEVIFSDDTRAEARLIGRDENSDIALIKVPASPRYVSATLGDSDKVVPGQLAFALGAPFGLDSTFTVGTISAKLRHIDDSHYSRIQTDASINPGNSGGPLLNVYGEVVGINQSIISPDGKGGSVGIGFAIPINEVKNVISQLKSEKRVIGKPALGVSVGVPTQAYREYLNLKDEPGLVVRYVIPGSAADEAGLQENDFILKANGREMKSPQDLIDEVQKAGVGGKMELQVIRNGKHATIHVKVGEDTDGGN